MHVKQLIIIFVLTYFNIPYVHYSFSVGSTRTIQITPRSALATKEIDVIDVT